MMNIFGTFNYPTRIVLEPKGIEKTADECLRNHIRNPFIAADQGIINLGYVDRLVGILKAGGLDPFVGTALRPDPIESDVLRAADEFSRNNCDGFVAIGGGSPIDAAKAISLRASHSLPLKDYDDSKGGDAFIDDRRLFPIIAVSTTSGTGAEVSRSGVVFIPEVGRKVVLFSPGLIPKTAILDPELTFGLPKTLTAWTGIDAFTHALEAYLAPNFHPMAEAISIEAMKMIRKNLSKAYFEPKNLEARASMALAATMAAAAFQKGLGAIHSMAHPLGSHGGLHHGFANAILLPYVTRKNHEASEEVRTKLSLLFKQFKEDSLSNAGDFFEDINSWWQELEIPGRIPGEVAKCSRDELADKAFEDACHQDNPVACTREMFYSWYGDLWPN